MIVSLDEAKKYLRIDTDAEDSTLELMLNAAQNLCMDVTRAENAAEFEALGEVAQIAVLYTLAQMYEAREDTDTHALTLRLRSLLFGVRKEAL